MSIKSTVIVSTLLISVAGATDLTTVNTDSLQRELEKINNQLELYEASQPQQVQTVEQLNVVPASVEVAEEPVSIKDEVVEEKRERRPGYGGGGGFVVGFKSINLSYLKTALKDDIKRKGEESPYYGLNIDDHLSGNYRTTLMSGVQGLAGLGNGIRIGGGVYGGANFLRSLYDENDSLYSMVIWTGYGGFIFEKSFQIKEGTQVIVGGLLGGGSQGSVLISEDDWYYHTKDDTATIESSYYDDNPYELAIGFAGEIHSAISHSFTPWFHLGFELSSVMFHSASGYKNGKGFTTFNPGGQLRFMFGKMS